MDLIKVFQRFPDHESCIEHLERVRWGDTPACPHCGALSVARKAENDRIGRWNCRECKSSFTWISQIDPSGDWRSCDYYEYSDY